MKALLVQKGFTLIELLIVIALLGALAVGLLASIDPVEQLNKGRDTGIRNSLEELARSSARYYSVKSQFPWGTASVTTSALYPNQTSALTELVVAGEMKSQFVSQAGTANLGRLYLTMTGGASSFYLCYQPSSKAFQKDSNTIYDISGGSMTTCKSQTSGTAGVNCYYCLQ